MNQKLRAGFAIALSLAIIAPFFPAMHVHAESISFPTFGGIDWEDALVSEEESRQAQRSDTRASDAPEMSLSMGRAASCSCNCITEPQMRALFKEYLSKEIVPLNATMVYNLGWGPTKEEIKNLQVFADIESSNDLVDWSYYQPKRVENFFRAEEYAKEAIRAINVLDRRAPAFYDVSFPTGTEAPTITPRFPSADEGEAQIAPPTLPEVSEDPEEVLPPPASQGIAKTETATGYALTSKRSLVIMSIYKAMGIEYFNKPVVYSAPLSPSGPLLYNLLDTPFFKQMPAADIKWNTYVVMNPMGRNYLFLDNNYLEGYMVRAVNDKVISQTELTGEFKASIDANYISKGSSDGGTATAGTCQKYIMVNRNGIGGSDDISADDLGVVYDFTDGNIKYNPNFTAMADESSCTTLDFCKYAYRIMYANGARVMTQQEKSATTALFGAKIPGTAQVDTVNGLGYLVINGIIPSDITPEKLNSLLTNEELLVYLSRIGDPETRLTYSYDVSTTDIAMANSGYAKTEVSTIPGTETPTNMEVEYDEGYNQYYDYYIPKEQGVTIMQDDDSMAAQHFALDPSTICSNGWEENLGDYKIAGKDFTHYRLRSTPPSNYAAGQDLVINSAKEEDRPRYITVPQGGGVYAYDRDLGTTPECTPTCKLHPLLKKVIPPVDVPGAWKDKPGVEAGPHPMPETSNQLVRFAGTGGTTTITFHIENFRSYRFNGVDLSQVPVDSAHHTFDKNGFETTINIKEDTFDGKKMYLITCTVPAEQTDSVSRMLKRTGESVGGYPAYLNRNDGDLLVSSKFLESKCSLKLIERDGGNLVTLYSATDNGVETTLVKDKNVAISGSTVIDFGSTLLFEPDAIDKGVYYINYKAIANQIAKSNIFISSDGTAKVNIETVKYTQANLSLYSDDSIKFGLTTGTNDAGDEMIVINSIPSSISSTMVMRRMGAMEDDPIIVQVKPVVNGKKGQSEFATSFFGSNQAFSSNNVVEIPISEFEYDKKTGMVWWEAPEESDYYNGGYLEGSILLPIFKGGGGYILANYPYLERKTNPSSDLADYLSMYTVFSTTTDTYKLKDWKGTTDNMLQKTFASGVETDTSEIKSEADYMYQTFPIGVPAYLHGVEDRKVSFKDLVQMADEAGQSKNTSPIVVYLMGGFYKPVRQTSSPNDTSATIAVAPISSNGSSDFGKEVSANRAAALSAKSSPVCESALSSSGEIQIKPDTMFMPLQVIGPEHGGKTPIIYISESEMMQLKLSGISSKMFGDDSVFGKLSAYSSLVFDTVNRSDLLNRLKMESFDGILQIIYMICLVVVPRVFIVSMFTVMALSLVTRYKVYEWFASRIFDPVAICSFGLVRYTELRPSIIWFSCGLGIVFLVMLSRGTLDILFYYLLDQILGILSRIKTFYIV